MEPFSPEGSRGSYQGNPCGPDGLAAPRPAPPIPGSMAAQVVQICCKGPDRVGAPEKNR
mgnify:CR=1 FL=1